LINIVLRIFDIDGTLCDTHKSDYMNAVPDEAMITLVNMLYDKGDTIWIITARGTGSGIDWYDKTLNQLHNWGVKFDRFEIGIIVSDKVVLPHEFMETLE